MTKPNCGTAILFFSLSPAAQAQKKQWKGISRVLAKKTHSKLFHHTEATIKKTGLPCIHSDEHNQRGSDFGTKLSNAIEDVFSLGYQNVIVLGNDCPKLNIKILDSAIHLVSENQTAIGPAQLGGVFLMAFQHSSFDKAAFQHLPWQTKDLQSSLLAYFQTFSATTVLLPFLADLNRYQDLYFFTSIRELSGNLFLIFQTLLQRLSLPSIRISSLKESIFYFLSISHRGPPAII